ncbi:hypothetical protein GCM10010123_36900 [Pilimelia anulata]|uniref:Uncharacterized protein n=1 Tax=Pilimelia anulata TaxID=53371 RepID=A0A8J3FF82_9ACTN|nr:glycosyltransferase [Pilimelia anulata]GGK03595.1 hypothetical protein GCM10010123_36900 [Pilimelia anulata]
MAHPSRRTPATPAQRRADRRRRLLGLLAAALGAGYLGWTVATLNPAAPWLAAPVAGAHALFVGQVWLAVVNHWHRSHPALPPPLPRGAEPPVAVVVPTSGEPVPMLRRTLCSVLDQDWPGDGLVLVVGDDAGRAAVRALVAELAAGYPAPALHYLRPPPRGAAARRGAGKAGNLNAALDLLDAVAPAARYVEFRDADDLVGDPLFLRRVVGHLAARPELAYAQTIKDARVSPGDPFGNRHALFYRGVLYSRDAAGAVPPCGSGLVWRRADLRAIGGLPTWSLVEDVYSGYVAWRTGRRGTHLPVRGAVAQIAPEDLPNVYRQRGTWALDTLRTFLWRCPLWARGLTGRQRAHLTEQAAYYLTAFPTLALILAPAAALLLDRRAVLAPPLPYAAATAAYLAAGTLFTRSLADRLPWRDLLRGRQVYTGLAPLFALAALRALWYGPRRKPDCPVTRKVHRPGLYPRLVLPQAVLCALLGTAVVVHLSRHALSTLDAGALLWACWHLWPLGRFVGRARYGWRARFHRRDRFRWRPRLRRPPGRRARPPADPGGAPCPPPAPAPRPSSARSTGSGSAG